MSIFHRPVAFCICLLLAGCVQHIPIHPQRAAEFVPWVDEPPVHPLEAGDNLALRYMLNPELNNNSLPIGPDGRISLPLLGPVMAAGQTVEEFDARIRLRYASILRDPQVDVLVNSYGSARVYVGGEVKTQSVIDLKGPTNVLQAVLAAGGVIETGSLERVVLIRHRSDGKPMLRRINLKRYIGYADAGDNVLLQPNDMIYVTKSDIASFDLFIDQYLNKAIPMNRTLNLNTGANGMFY